MRILYHHRTQAQDGQAVHIRALQDAFARLGHEVREVGLVAQGQDGGANGTAEAQRSRWAWVTRMPGFVRELAEYGYGPVGKQRILREAAHFEPDFLYERYAFGNGAGVLAARKLGVPLVLEVNSPMVLELTRTRGLALPGLARRVEGWVFTSADVVCVVTAVLRNMLVELGVDPGRLLVTPNGVDLERFSFPDPDAARAAARADLGLPPEAEDALGGPVLGFVGYYRPWHRLDLAVDALARPELAGARLVLVGEGPAREEIEARAREVGAADRVVFAGTRPHEAIADVLPGFDVALVPAINPYASPLKLHEYMAASLPTVAPRQPNLEEVLTHGEDALLFAKDDAESFTRALLDLAADDARRRAIGERARATIVERDLTWGGNARRVVEAVEALGVVRA